MRRTVVPIAWCMVAIFMMIMVMMEKTVAGNVLDARRQGMIPIAAFTAKGDGARLKTALEEGLDQGLTVNEIKEILIQMYAYAGFPRSLEGLKLFLVVLDERKARGIVDETGKDATRLPVGTDRYVLGTAVQTKIAGKPVEGPVYEFAPVINTFLREHLFGDIFGRDVLDFQDRELATAAALASLPAETQLRSHLKGCLNVGLSSQHLKEFVTVLETKVGKSEAQMAARLLDDILQQ